MIVPYHAGVNQIWSLPDHSQNGTYLLLSFPSHSEHLYISADLKTVEQQVDDVTSGLEFDSRTLTAGAFGDTAVQITQRSVRITRLGPTDSSNGHAAFAQTYLGTEKIVAAAIHSPTCSIVTVVRKDGATHLCVGRVHDVDG